MKIKISRKGRAAVTAPVRLSLLRRSAAIHPAAELIAAIELIRADLAKQNGQHREDLATMARGFCEVLDDKATLQARVATLEQELCGDYERSQENIAALEQQCDWLHAESEASAKAARMARDTSAKLGAQVTALTRQNADLLAKLGAPASSAGGAAPIASPPLALPPVKAPQIAKQAGSKRSRPAPLPVRSMAVKRSASST